MCYEDENKCNSIGTKHNSLSLNELLRNNFDVRYNIKDESVARAVELAKKSMFRILSKRYKDIVENDIEVLLVQNEFGEKVNLKGVL